MGGQIAMATAGKLLRRGMRPSVPAGIVINAGRKDRTFLRGTLGAMASNAAVPDGPAIIFVGEAVAHGDWAEATAIAEQNFKVA